MSESASRRPLIIRAARQCFADDGYDKTTLTAIAERVGITGAALYYYFSSKQDLFAAVAVESTQLISDALSEVLVQEQALMPRLICALEVRAKLHISDPSLARFNAISPIEMMRRPELRKLFDLKRGESPVPDFFKTVVADARRTGELLDGDDDVIAEMLGVLYFGLVYYGAVNEGADRHLAVVDAMRLLFSGKLLTPSRDAAGWDAARRVSG